MPFSLRFPRPDDRGEESWPGKAAGITVGFTCGAFDPFPHPGHLQMLAEARGVCDRLVVGLQTDPTLDRPFKHKPVCSVEERRIMLESIRWVDEIVLYSTEQSLLELLERLKPDVRILGADYLDRSFTGDHLNIPVYFARRDHDWSSTAFLQRIQQSKAAHEQPLRVRAHA